MRPLQQAFFRKPASVHRYPLESIVIDRRQRRVFCRRESCAIRVKPRLSAHPSAAEPSEQCLVRPCLVGNLSTE